MKDHLIRGYEFPLQIPDTTHFQARTRASAIASNATKKAQGFGGSVWGGHLSLLVSMRTTVKRARKMVLSSHTLGHQAGRSP
jgi:hypothetical protein